MLTRYRGTNDPFSLFQDLMRFQDTLWNQWRNEDRGRLEPYAPACDLWEDKDAFYVEAELPGMKTEDVEIAFENNVLTLRGERKQEKSTEEQGFRHSERVYGKFARAFRLPETVDAEGIEATMEDGLLKVRLPKKTEAKPRKIEVKAKGRLKGAS